MMADVRANERKTLPRFYAASFRKGFYVVDHLAQGEDRIVAGPYQLRGNALRQAAVKEYIWRFTPPMP